MCSLKINYTNQSFLLTKLKTLAEKAPAEIHTLTHLSQMIFHQELSNSPTIIEALKKTIHTLIQRMHEKRPREPLQLHLGRHSSEKSLSQSIWKAYRRARR